MDSGDWIGLVAVLAAIAIPCLGYVLHRDIRRRDRLRFMHEYRSFLFTYIGEFSELCADAIQFANVCHLIVDNIEFEDRKQRIAQRLSSLMDRGRFIFPNTMINEYGSDKMPGFKGYRSMELNRIFSAYSALGCLKSGPLEENEFTGTVQLIESESENIYASLHWLSDFSIGELESKSKFSVADVISSARRDFISDVWERLKTSEWEEEVLTVIGATKNVFKK
jgi:hypothetical protein